MYVMSRVPKSGDTTVPEHRQAYRPRSSAVACYLEDSYIVGGYTVLRETAEKLKFMCMARC